jgi:cobalt-precorrin 5A hydrolase/precorrin-3B C17-methyltransferase
MASAAGNDGSTRLGIIAITRIGAELGRTLKVLLGGDLHLPARLASGASGELVYQPPLISLVREIFPLYTHLVFVMSTGIAVRCVAPMLRGKKSDPGVIVIDEKGQNVISLIGGHQRKTNQLAREIAMMIGGKPVVTTASDLHGLPSLDTWIREKGWYCRNEKALPGILRALVDGEIVGVFQETGEEIEPLAILPPSRIHRYTSLGEVLSSPVENSIVVSDRRLDLTIPSMPQGLLWLVPRTLVLGVGCRKGVSSEEIESAMRLCFEEEGLCEESVFSVATLDIKRSERGLLGFARSRGLGTMFFTPGELEEGVCLSAPRPRTAELVGISPVCEKAALKASGDGELVVPKRIFGRVTLAVARKAFRVSRESRAKIYLVGIGPGAGDLISPKAMRALSASSTIIGYSSYVDRLSVMLQGKRIISGGMGGEKERATLALRLAAEGNVVSLVSGGDPGIYGMASYIGELIAKKNQDKKIAVETVPGIPAFCAAAAKLGFPISSDFAVISLSDYYVDWSLIEKRLEAAAVSDMVIILYNPSSPQRKEHLARAAKVLLRYRDEKCPVGMAKKVTLEGEELVFLELRELMDMEADMNSLFIIGNSESRMTDTGIYTPRGGKGGGGNGA